MTVRTEPTRASSEAVRVPREKAIALAGVAMGEMKAKEPARVAGSMSASGWLLCGFVGVNVGIMVLGGGPMRLFGCRGVNVGIYLHWCIYFIITKKKRARVFSQCVPAEVDGDAAQGREDDVGAGDVGDEVGDEDDDDDDGEDDEGKRHVGDA